MGSSGREIPKVHVRVPGRGSPDGGGNLAPIADVARELGINETSLGNWVRAYRKKHAGDEPPLELSERARLRELERRNRELEMENAFLKKGVPRTLEAA
jgi:transposase